MTDQFIKIFKQLVDQGFEVTRNPQLMFSARVSRKSRIFQKTIFCSITSLNSFFSSSFLCIEILHGILLIISISIVLKITSLDYVIHYVQLLIHIKAMMNHSEPFLSYSTIFIIISMIEITIYNNSFLNSIL